MTRAPPWHDDAELAVRAAKGDERAFTALMRIHKGTLFHLVRRLVGYDDAAFDIVQETFVGLWRGIGRYDPALPFGAWARRAAVNKTRDWARRRKVRRFISGLLGDSDIDADQRPDLSPTPEQQVVDRRELARAEAAIQALPDKLKEPLVLTALEGLSYAEAALILGVTKKAVETRISRARCLLAAQLEISED